MKLMFASDIHGSLPATERVLELFAQSGAQWLVILGDVLNHGPRNALPEGYAPAKVAERLNEVAHKVIAVRGNCDSEVDQMLLHFPITAPLATGITWKTTSVFDAWIIFLALENLPALNHRTMCWCTVIPICQWQNSGGRFSTSTPAR